MGGPESAEALRKRQLRWREKHPEAWSRLRSAQKRRYYRQFQRNDHHKGRRWSPADDAKITAKRRPSDRQLSRALGRSAQAIQQRRVRLSATR